MLRHPILMSKDYIDRLKYNLKNNGIMATLMKAKQKLLGSPPQDTAA